MSSFVSYIFRTFFKAKRGERTEIKVPCRYVIDSKTDPITEKNPASLSEGVMINYSTKGLGVITAPAFDEEKSLFINKEQPGIYVEFMAPETGAKVKIQGQIRWEKNVADVARPYSEMGIMVTYVQDDSKTELFNTLFQSGK